MIVTLADEGAWLKSFVLFLFCWALFLLKIGLKKNYSNINKPKYFFNQLPLIRFIVHTPRIWKAKEPGGFFARTIKTTKAQPVLTFSE